MDISAIGKTIETPQQKSANQQEALRKAAMQFEAILLNQLTAELNKTSDDEDPLFGSDGGSGLAKQLFSEQMASKMADSGGIGIADQILRQYGVDTKNHVRSGDVLAKATSAVKALKTAPAQPEKQKVIVVGSAAKDIKPAKISIKAPVSNDFEVVSTYTDDFKANGIDPSMTRMILNGEIQSSSRTRVVPNAKVTENLPTVAPVKLKASPDIAPTRITEKTITVDKISDVKSDVKVQYSIPARGRVSSEFGMRFHPIDKRHKLHTGMDIAAPAGTPIGSAADGVVIFAGKKGGYGNRVVVQHADGKETAYNHAKEITVKVGDTVDRGQTIATVGSTGKSTGPHLHFEVRENGRLVNPRNLLSNVYKNRADK